MSGKASGVDTYLPAACVVFVVASVAFLPASLHPLAYNLSALLAGTVLVVRALATGRLKGISATMAVAGAVPVVALALSAATSSSPGVSLAGLYGQHSGWMLYAALYLTAVGGLALASPTGLRRTVVVASVLGAALAAAALLERTGLFSWGPRYSTDPSGFLDNPTSLGQMLLVTAGCSIAWAITARSRSGRAGAIACAAAAGAGIVASRVMGASIGVAGAVAAGLILHYARPASRRRADFLSLGVAAVLVASVGIAGLLSSSLPSPEMQDSLRSASNLRTEIWASSFAIIKDHPVAGVGPDQFGTLQTWRGAPSGELDVSSTFDPHNSLVAILVAGGILAFGAALFVLWLYTREVLRAHAAIGLPPAALTIASATVGWAASTIVAWIYLPAGALAMIALGSVLGMAAGPREDAAPAWIEPAGRLTAGTIAVLAATVLVYTAVVPAPVEAAYGWGTRMGKGTGFPLAEARASFERWPDPQYASAALDGYFAKLVAREVDSAPEALLLVERSGPASRRDARTAFARIKVLQAAAAVTGRDLYPDFVEAVEDGRSADPRSGLWDYAAVLESLRLGRKADAARFARQALRYDQSEENRSWLRAVAAGKAGLDLQ